jgi:hypothetical protein
MVKKFFKVGIGPPGLFLCVKTLKIRRRIFTRAESLAACVPGRGSIAALLMWLSDS